MAELKLTGARKSFGTIDVLHGIDLTVMDGEFVVFVGPSGCGKSTLLRVIAGLENLTSGEVHIDGERVTHLPASERGLAMVFQSYALYPHMSVRKNMAFALENMGLKPADIEARVARAATMLRLTDYLDRKPKALSGGQRQRVAIGRAIVRDPKIFLFDEPLSNLDAELRVATRKELAALHANIGGTMIYVTHDQVEAMTLADRIVVLNAGRIEQIGTPLELYNRPSNAFVAGFIGSPRMNFLPAVVISDDGTLRLDCWRTRSRLAARSFRPRRRGERDARHPSRTCRRRGGHRHARGKGRSCRTTRRRDVRLCHCSRTTADYAAPGWPIELLPRRCSRDPLRPRPPAHLRCDRRGSRPALIDLEPDLMKALTHGRFRGLDGDTALFDLATGPGAAPLASLRVAILERDIGRVTLRRPEGYRLDRGWAIAPNRAEPPFEGRWRDDMSGFANPASTVSEADGIVTLAAAGLSARVRLDPFGIAWYRDGEDQPFLRDRPTQAYFLSRKSGTLLHAMERHEGERHYGLGDKAGPLDRTGRRFAIDAVDPCGFDAELSDPLYKMLPFFIVDGTRRAHGIFYDNLALGSVDLGCTIDNYHGLFRSYRAEDGDLDYYVLAGPTVPDVTRRFSWLTGGQAFAPRWTLGFAMTTMTIADAPDADARITAFIEDCKRHGIRCDSFHFGSGYTSIGNRRYVFNWNRDKFPDPAATMARLKAAGMQPVTNIKPCLLDDHPRLEEAQRARHPGCGRRHRRAG